MTKKDVGRMQWLILLWKNLLNVFFLFCQIEISGTLHFGDAGPFFDPYLGRKKSGGRMQGLISSLPESSGCVLAFYQNWDFGGVAFLTFGPFS